MSAFAKVYRSLWDGTLAQSWATWSVFVFMLAHVDNKGHVDMTVRAISLRSGVPEADVREAIEHLSRPDPESRSREEEGRRLVLIDPARSWGWRVVNHAKYRATRDRDRRREQTAAAMRRYRARKAARSAAQVREPSEPRARARRSGAQSTSEQVLASATDDAATTNASCEPSEPGGEHRYAHSRSPMIHVEPQPSTSEQESETANAGVSTASAGCEQGEPGVSQCEPKQKQKHRKGTEDSAEPLSRSTPAAAHGSRATRNGKAARSAVLGLMGLDPAGDAGQREVGRVAGSGEVVVVLPCVGGQRFTVSRSMLTRWQAAYPAVNVEQELREMVAWLDANRARRKTVRGCPAFVINWLGREQDKGGVLRATASVPAAAPSLAQKRTREGLAEEERAARNSVPMPPEVRQGFERIVGPLGGE